MFCPFLSQRREIFYEFLTWLAIMLSQSGSNGQCQVSNSVCGASGVVGTPGLLTQMYQLLGLLLPLICALFVIGCILCHLGCGIAQTDVHTATTECPSVVMTSTRNLSGTIIQRHFASLGESRNEFANIS